MSWISNLAGKAEDILNKIDSEAATALTKETRNSGLSHSKTPVISDHKRSSSYSLPSSSSVPSNLSDVGNAPHHSMSSSFRESGSLTSSPKKRTSLNKVRNQEQSLIDFLNDSKKKSSDLQVSHGNDNHANPSHTDIGHSRHSSISSGSSFLAVSGRETPGFATLEIDTNSGGSHSSDAYVNVDTPSNPPLSASSSYHSNDSDGSASGNAKEQLQRQSDVALLRKEVSSLNQEMTQVLKRAKEAEKESQRCKDQLSTLTLQQRQSEALLRNMQERETEMQEHLKTKEKFVESLERKFEDANQKLLEREKTNKELQDQNQRLLQGADVNNSLHSEMVRSLQEKLKEAEDALLKERERHFTTDKQLSERICQLQEDQKTLSKDLSEAQRRSQEERNKITSLNNQISSLKTELGGAREELSDYKSKAGRILQSKDLLITSLKEGKGGSDDERVHAEETEQLRGERDLLREELERCGERIKQLSGEVAQTEALAQHEARDALQKLTQLQEDFAKEQSEVSLVQEELRQNKQEMRCLQEELTRQKVSLSSRIQERDGEIQRLQKQIAHKQSSSSSASELENRIHGLTESLIHKQTTIESLSTDKHTLQIQLEKLQQQYNESQIMLNKDPVIDISQEEVRNRVPSFLLESPFDGGVTRRVKKAYGTLDKFSVRLGVFLRRYPIARVFVLLYMGLLHAWVMIVLLTYKPEIHGEDFLHPHPVGFGGTAPRGPHGH